jgi:hypothetical protein
MTTTPHLVKPETQVNTTDGGQDQFQSRIAPLQDGGYVVVWTDESQTYNEEGSAIVGQRYDSAGNKVGGDPAHGGEVMLSQFDDGDQFAPAVTTLANGNIAMAFADFFTNGVFTEHNIRVNVFDPSLHAVRNDDINLGSTQTDDPSLTALADGSYVVSYTVGSGTHTDVVARHVSATGVVGTQFNLAHPVGGSFEPQADSHLATLSNGNVVAVYQDTFPSSTPDTDIRFSVLTPDGTPVLDHFGVPGGVTSNSESEPDVAALRSGGFVVTWTDPSPREGTDVRASIIGNDGHPVASDLLVNTHDGTSQFDSDVVALATAASWSPGSTASPPPAANGSMRSATRSAPSSRWTAGRTRPSRVATPPCWPAAASPLPSTTFQTTSTSRPRSGLPAAAMPSGLSVPSPRAISTATECRTTSGAMPTPT